MSDIIHSLGRRTTSVARIYMKKGKGSIIVNDKNYTQYFPTSVLQFMVEQPFNIVPAEKNQHDIKAIIAGID